MYLPGDLIDGRFNNYLLEHAYRYFTGLESSFWEVPFMYPEPRVITYSDNLLGSAPFYILFRLFGCSLESSFQGWYLVATVLNYTCSYFFLNAVIKNKYAAVIGAMVFTFALSLHSQMGHAQTFPRYGIPLAFLMGYLFLKELKPIYFFGAVFFVVYQIYCGIYIGFMLAAAFGLFLIVSLIVKYRLYLETFKSGKWWLFMILGLIVNILLLLPLMLPYMERAATLGLYSYDYVSKSLLTPKSFIFSWGGTLFWAFLNGMCIKDFGNYCDYMAFPGAVATVGFVCFVIIVFYQLLSGKIRHTSLLNSELLVLFFGALLTFLFFMRIGNFSLYALLYHVPGFGSMRALQRIINIELVFYALGASFAFDLAFTKSRHAGLIFSACVVFFILDNYVRPSGIHRLEISDSIKRLEPLREKIKKVQLGKIISYEPDTVDSSINDFQLDAMLASQSLGYRTINGYSAVNPSNYGNFWTNPNESSRMEWLNARGLSMDSVAVVK